MPIHLKEQTDSNVVVIHVSGKLAPADYEHLVPKFERPVGVRGKVCVLFDMKAFHGWMLGAVWRDTKFAMHHFNDIDRLAMIDDKKRQVGVAAICQPFTKVAVEYFGHAHEAEARTWLNESQTTA